MMDNSDSEDEDFNPNAPEDSDGSEGVIQNDIDNEDDDDESDDEAPARTKAAPTQNLDDEDDDEDDEDEDDEDDEEDDDDDEEDEEDDRGRGGRPPKKRMKRNIFLDDAADDDRYEEEVEDDEEREFQTDSHWDRERRAAEARIQRRQEQEAKLRAQAEEAERAARAQDIDIDRESDEDEEDDDDDDDDLDEQSRLRQLENRYAEDTEVQDISDNRQLPTMKDPKLYMVKCQLGKEHEVAIQLMRKKLSYIYIEAYRPAAVKEAITGIMALRYGQYDQKLVPMDDMPRVLAIQKQTVTVKPGAWVRLKRGVYRDDLAKVVEVTSNEKRTQVTVHLLPRLDLNADATTRNSTVRAPKRRFDPDEVRAIRGDDAVQRASTVDDYTFEFERNIFIKGYLRHRVPLTSLQIEDVNATLDEIAEFEGTDDSAVAAAIEEDESSKTNFVVGDRVIAYRGNLKNAFGVIETIREDGTVVLRVENQELRDLDRIPVPKEDLRKHFRPADHVKVQRGRYEGQTGLVLEVNDQRVTVLIDLTMKQIESLSRDLEICETIGTGLDAHGQFALFDLVQMTQAATVGVIIAIERDEFKILDQNGQEKTIKSQQVKPIGRKHQPQTFDSQQNVVARDSMARVVDGPNKGRSGKVKYIHRGYVFLQDRGSTEHNGIFVCRGRHLQGHQGIVTDATETTVRVELHARNRIISLKTQHVKEIPAFRSDQGQFDKPGWAGSIHGARTPFNSAQTPLYTGAETPRYTGAETPHGNQTPRMGSQTPRGAHTNGPAQGMTPGLTPSLTPGFTPQAYTPGFTPGMAPTPGVASTPMVDEKPIWLHKGIMVELRGRSGYIASVDGYETTVVLDDGATETVRADELSTRPPAKDDTVFVLPGSPSHPESVALFVTIDHDEGVIRKGADLAIVPLQFLAVVHPSQVDKF
ncbi:uncharacterized protein MONBRDRAFT_37124 [Monosiga brevicollis MX1]|uniref:KOW domain-containing protein n=1 Tax=Monosiga brevicollis TaxID=81824 RepID=A9UZR3_MONBE|nr:uncharacterized protein MONBRDRAFT_37124 [Monosiga brevicollis MX1]EDQ89413.1 predicted protein [Monosiga brevicollis MX1]|eukprot:XP_001745989.1 hypothetical protein [Monosiga brevicollis MX1]